MISFTEQLQSKILPSSSEALSSCDIQISALVHAQGNSSNPLEVLCCYCSSLPIKPITSFYTGGTADRVRRIQRKNSKVPQTFLSGKYLDHLGLTHVLPSDSHCISPDRIHTAYLFPFQIASQLGEVLGQQCSHFTCFMCFSIPSWAKVLSRVKVEQITPCASQWILSAFSQHTFCITGIRAASVTELKDSNIWFTLVFDVCVVLFVVSF